jgi:signal transduction histidine kinase
MFSTWATVANISRRKHAQREQDRLQQLLDLQAAREVNAQFQERIIAVLGHDLRNPLTAVLMGAHALTQSRTEETKAIMVRRILSSTKRMRRMIDQLLDFTRSRHAGIRVAPAPTDIACVVRRVLDELEMANPKRSLRLNVDGATIGEWDADRLEQVISNLAANAIRYGDAATDIDVALIGGAEQITIAVHNCGAPIAPDLLPLIFDPFRRGTNNGAEGLGLGLFITREIVEAHGGTIAVASTPTDGTTFSVVLPRHASIRLH